MKIWNEYGSEHSMNLVMIGHFKEVRDAEKVKELLERFAEQVLAEPNAYGYDLEPQEQRFSDAMLDLMKNSNVYNVGTCELEQFTYEKTIRIEGSDLVLTTEESDVSAILKILLDKGARVEVYSAHAYPDTGYGRGC